MIVDQLSHALKITKEYLDSNRLYGLTTHRWHKIITCLEFKPEQLVAVLNETFKQRVHPPGSVGLDEIIWAGDTNWIFIREHPDKPITLGLKVFNIAFRLPKTNRPYCYPLLS